MGIAHPSEILQRVGQRSKTMLTGAHNAGWMGTRGYGSRGGHPLCARALGLRPALRRSRAACCRGAAQIRSGVSPRPAAEPAAGLPRDPRAGPEPMLRSVRAPAIRQPRRAAAIQTLGIRVTPYAGPGFSRPARPGYAQPFQAPPGHLGDWLNQHRNLSVQEQERICAATPASGVSLRPTSSG